MIRRPPRSTPFPTRRSSDLYLCLNNLGTFAAHRPGGMEEAARYYGEAVRIKPDSPEAQNNLASALDRKSTRLNSSHANISYAVFCLKKKKKKKKRVFLRI